LLDAGLVQIASTMTDGAGMYLFSGLAAGDYTVMVVAPAGTMESPAGQGGNPALDSNCVGGMAPVTLPTVLSVDLTIDCGLIPPVGKIGDFIFEDLNGNGIQDGGEPGIPGVTVKLLDAGLVQIATVVTDGTGMYMFGGLSAGTYTVMIDGTTVPPGYTESPPNVGGNDNVDSDCVGGMVLVVLPTNTTIDNSVDCGLVPPGACCFDDGTCAVLSSDDCNAANGVPQGPGTTCATVMCPAPACCFPDGTCQELLAADCLLAGGAPQGAGTSCTPNICPPPLGACCLNDGTCQNVTAAQCTILGGAYQGDLTTCAGVVCPAPGACCLPDGTCRQELVLGGAQCLADGGTYQGDDSLCANVVCPFGACCVGPNCIEISPAGCTAMGGAYQGDGTMCVNVDCAPATPMRGNCGQKGSLLIFSKVELRWDAAGNPIQDTFIQLTNDYPDDVKVQMYFINGDPPLAATIDERAHPGWNWVDNLIMLTGDQPVAWSAMTGTPGGIGVSPFATALDPGFPPGRPCPDGSGERCMRGFIVAWAVDNQNNRQIRWDHLAGEATLVNYGGSYAWQYTACAYQVVDALVPHGGPVGMAGMINLDGIEYEAVYDLLLMQFQAANSGGFGGPVGVVSDGDLTLHAVSGDFRQETDGPITTKASFEVWNMNELKFSGLHRCVTCWDQTLFSQYTDNGPANHLLLANLQTAHGKARIDGLQSQLCDVDFDPNNNVDFPFPPGPGDATDPRDIVSQAAALTGLRATFLRFGAANVINAAAGGNLVGMGFQTAAIKYDPVNAPPSTPTEEDGRTPNTKPAEADAAFDGLLLDISPASATSSVLKR
ncbi:MAG: hypothetical protein KC983_04730, partial [Phycisphaerales bacterium]|nr:hypothetical protein [Phycisphaerales bacterium]